MGNIGIKGLVVYFIFCHLLSIVFHNMSLQSYTLSAGIPTLFEAAFLVLHSEAVCRMGEGWNV